jgi:3-hydroxyisobutyrate dehydrogenase-like beta-hydroxyacid dehydrogenase
MDKMLKIAILGLGEAGSHFANDLIDLGVEIIGFDPNPVRKINEKVILAKSNTEAVKNADVIFSANLSSVSVASPLLGPK